MIVPKKRKAKKEIKPVLYTLPIFLFIIYILFLLVRAVWANFGINQEIKSLKSEISQLEDKNKNLQNLISYYQSSTYKEREARLKLGYIKPGEKVIILPKEEETSQETESQKKQSEQKSQPSYLKWWEFFFK